MNFEPGTFYSTRDGHKFIVYATNGAPDQEIHGAIFFEGEWRPSVRHADGKFYKGTNTPHAGDLVAPWNDGHIIAERIEHKGTTTIQVTPPNKNRLTVVVTWPETYLDQRPVVTIRAEE